MASPKIQIGGPNGEIRRANDWKLMKDSEKIRVTENDMRKRIDELESALMPFAVLGKTAVTEAALPKNLSVSSSLCIGAFRTLFKQQ